MSPDLVIRVEAACAQLVEAGQTVTFTAVAARAGIAKATLYRRPELRAIVEGRRIAAGRPARRPVPLCPLGHPRATA